MRKYSVTFDCFHESFGGYDQNDGEATHIVKASTRQSAINKAKKKEFGLPKGKQWSQSRWGSNYCVEEIK